MIHESATVGEYQRAIQNIERILRVLYLEEELSKSGGGLESRKTFWVAGFIILMIGITGLLIVVFLSSGKNATEEIARDDMLKWTFETSFVNPFTKLDDLPDNCDFPCYKYQGKWTLNKEYKIPFFREQSGFHYLATEVNLYTRCMSEKDSAGNTLEGYEYQKHEIWYDKRELPIDSFIYHNNYQLRNFYQDMDFTKDEDFVKVATVHTFFRNEFTIGPESIIRTGKVIGRDLEFISDEDMQDSFGDRKKIYEIESALNRISRTRLEDFSRPIACDDSPLPNSDFHAIKNGDLMSFECQLTTSRVPMNYVKTFVLTDQYIKNTCRPTP